MSIPTISDGQTLISVRMDTLNPMVEQVNTNTDTLLSTNVDLKKTKDDVTTLAGGFSNLFNTTEDLKAEDVRINADISTVGTRVSALETTVNNYHTPVVSEGIKYKSDLRVFAFSTSNNYAGFIVTLEADEYPVRAVVRTYDTANKKGAFFPVSDLGYDRTTNVLTATVNSHRVGQLFIEFWGPA